MVFTNALKGNTRAITFSQDGINFYGRFLDTAVVDQLPRPTLVGHAGNDVVLTLPHFWNYAALDPGNSTTKQTIQEIIIGADFSVLFNRNSNSDCLSAVKSSSGGGVNKNVVVSCCLFGVVFFYWERYQ